MPREASAGTIEALSLGATATCHAHPPMVSVSVNQDYSRLHLLFRLPSFGASRMGADRQSSITTAVRADTASNKGTTVVALSESKSFIFNI